MSYLHTGSALLERNLRRGFRTRDYRGSLRRGKLLCKPFSVHCSHFSGQTASHPGKSIGTGFRRSGDPVRHRQPADQTLIPLCQACRRRFLLLQFFGQFICSLQTISPSYQISPQPLRHRYHKLHSSSGRSKILIPFSPCFYKSSSFRHNITETAPFFCCAVFIRQNCEKGDYHKMNIGILLLIIVGGAAGGLSTLYLIVSFLGTLGFKIYRKVKYGASLYD